MTIFATKKISLWRIRHLERNGEYLNFLKEDLRGFFFWQSTYVTGSLGKISALYDFFPGISLKRLDYIATVATKPQKQQGKNLRKLLEGN